MITTELQLDDYLFSLFDMVYHNPIGNEIYIAFG